MSKLRIDYVNFHEKMLDPIVKAFGNNKLAVVNVKASNMAKRENGVAIKEAQFEFKSGQKLVLKVKADGGVFQVKLNGKVLPVKEVFDVDAAFKEIVKMTKQNEAAYLAQKEKQQEQAAKRLARTAVVRASSSAQAKLEAAQAKLSETNDMISTTRTDAQPFYDNLSAKQTELSQLTGRISELEVRNIELDGLIKETETQVSLSGKVAADNWASMFKDEFDKVVSVEPELLEGTTFGVAEANKKRERLFKSIVSSFGNDKPGNELEYEKLRAVIREFDLLKRQSSASWWNGATHNMETFKKDVWKRIEKSSKIKSLMESK